MEKRTWSFFVKTSLLRGWLDKNGYLFQSASDLVPWEGATHQAGQEATRRASLFERISLQEVELVTFDSRKEVIGGLRT